MDRHQKRANIVAESLDNFAADKGKNDDHYRDHLGEVPE
jgi:hypothetical protein